jgi:hypothetical protein
MNQQEAAARKLFRTEQAPSAQLADMILGFSHSFPKDVTVDVSVEGLWRFWNVAISTAAHRLYRVILLLTESGYEHEAHLPSRTLLELYGNQVYMRADKSRARDFLHQVTGSKAKILEMMKDKNLIDDEQYEDARRTHEGERTWFEDTFGESDPEIIKKFTPFGVGIKDRLKVGGVEWLYETFFGPASDHTHMNARALELYVDSEPEGMVVHKDPEPSSGGALSVATQMMLRIFYVVDEALEQGQSDVLDGLTKEYWKLHARKGLTFEHLRDNMRLVDVQPGP